MKNKARILLFDIETAPLVSYTWGLWEQNVVDVKDDWYMLSFAYKWLGERETNVLSLPDYKLYEKEPRNDFKLVEELWSLFDKADVIIAHNGDDFDIKKARVRFLKHGLQPPSPFKTIDTKKIAKKYFKFDSNSLDKLGKYLGLGRKIKHEGFELWLGCMDGDPKSWDKMCKYNKQDVILLEKVYKKMLPYVTNHPNMNLYNETTHSCPNCGSNKLRKRGFAVSRVNRYQRFQCNDCGSWSQKPLNGDSVIR